MSFTQVAAQFDGDQAITAKEAAAAAGLVPGTWTIDPSHSEIAFTVRHLMTKVRGTFEDFSGTLTVAENPLASTVDVTVQTASLTTGTKQRDDHVRSGDFLSVEEYPAMTFKATGIQVTGESTFVLSGDLTVKGVTKPVELAAEFLGVATDQNGAMRAGFEATGSINRTEFGVDGNVPLGEKMLIGTQVGLQLSVQAVLDG